MRCGRSRAGGGLGDVLFAAVPIGPWESPHPFRERDEACAEDDK